LVLTKTIRKKKTQTKVRAGEGQIKVFKYSSQQLLLQSNSLLGCTPSKIILVRTLGVCVVIVGENNVVRYLANCDTNKRNIIERHYKQTSNANASQRNSICMNVLYSISGTGGTADTPPPDLERTA
jgi:hypothetical protein